MTAGSADEGAGDAELLARVTLARCAEPGDARFGSWLADVGALAAVEELRRGRCPVRRGETYLARFAGARPDDDLALAERIGVRIVVPGTSGWPTQLDDLGPCRPVLLWLRGPADLRRSALCSVAVVGARAATRYGEGVATELAASLAEAHWTVVSGGAYGIDASAHRGTLAVDATTVAVLASGPDTFYPRGNDALLARIADVGVVVTELAPGEHPTRSRFLERNRVIAALTRGTVVVEAASRSGALNTATRAAELRRVVMGVPGPVTSAASAGVHRLLRDGEAVLVTRAGEVIELLTPVTAGAAPQAPTGPLDGLPPDVRALHDAMALRRARPLEDLAIRAGVPEREVLGLLGELRLRGLAERVEGGWRAVRPEPA